jgi:hypothetical protein
MPARLPEFGNATIKLTCFDLDLCPVSKVRVTNGRPLHGKRASIKRPITIPVSP